MDVDALSKERTSGKGKKGPGGSGKGNKDQNLMNDVKCWNCDRTGHYGRDCREKWSGDKGNAKSKESKGKQGKNGKGRSKGKLNSVERNNWQGHVHGWPKERTPQPHRDQDAEHVDEWRNEEHSDGWWKSSDSDGWRKPLEEQTGSSSGRWVSTETEAPCQPQEPVGGFEVNNIGSLVDDAELRQWCSCDGIACFGSGKLAPWEAR